MRRRAFLRLSGGGGYLFLLTACSVKAAPPATNGQPERSMPPPTALPTAAHAQPVLTPVAATATPVAAPTILHPQEPAHTPAALSPTPAVTGEAQMVIGAYTVSKDETGTSFLGYLVNTGKVACEGIQVAATLQDAGGRAIATQTSYDVR